MAVAIKLTSNAKAVKRKLKKFRRHRVFNAERQIMDAGAQLAKKTFVRQWKREFDVRRQSFPKAVLRVRKSYINFSTGNVIRSALLRNASANNLLLLQMFGGIRKPRGQWLLVPQKKGQRKPRRRYVRGQAMMKYLKRSPDTVYAILTKQARIPRRFPIRIVQRRVERVLPRVAERILRAELRRPVT